MFEGPPADNGQHLRAEIECEIVSKAIGVPLAAGLGGSQLILCVEQQRATLHDTIATGPKWSATFLLHVERAPKGLSKSKKPRKRKGRRLKCDLGALEES